MQKEELLHLHMLFVHVKKNYETISHDEINTEEYDSLKISPVHIHKNKKCHKEAILVLGNEIIQQIQNNHPKQVDYAQDQIKQEITVHN